MSIYLHECRKLLFSLAIWGFVLLAMGLNLFLVGGSFADPYSRWVGTTAHVTGASLTGDYSNRLAQVQVPPEQSPLQDQLRAETEAAEEIYANYSTRYIADSYIAAGKLTPVWADKMHAKYDALQQEVNRKAAKGESLSLYFASATYSMHQQLFSQLSGFLLTEGGLLMALLIFLSVGYETLHRTEAVVCSTRTGRRVNLLKLLAALSIGLLFYGLLSAVTYASFFQLHDYGAIWQSHVSSLFNYRHDLLTGVRPFIAWGSFTVGTYFLATYGLSVGVILCFGLLAYIIALVCRQLYLGFFLFLAANACMVLLPMRIPASWPISFGVKFYSIFSPVWLWLKRSLWFTDGDADIVWRYFEIKGLAASAVVLILLCLLAAAFYKRRDLT